MDGFTRQSSGKIINPNGDIRCAQHRRTCYINFFERYNISINMNKKLIRPNNTKSHYNLHYFKEVVIEVIASRIEYIKHNIFCTKKSYK